MSSGRSLHQSSRRRFLRGVGAAVIGAALESRLRALLGSKALLADAAELSRAAVTVDLHCHANALGGAHFPRPEPELAANMKAGGLDCGLFALRGDYPVIGRDSSGQRYERRQPKPGELLRRTMEQLDAMIDATQTGQPALARSAAEIIGAKKAGLPSAMLALEGSDALEGQIARVKFFYDRGVRVLPLMHYRFNEIGDIQTAPPRHNGLTPFGREVVREMNRLGMLIDTAPCSPATLNGVLDESRQPVLFSHTGPSALRAIARHLDDQQMLALARKGGLVGVWPSLRRTQTFDDFLTAVDYVKRRIGADHVGIGSDLFGLRGATAVPTHKSFALIPAGLLHRGFTEAEVVKIIGANCMRVLDQVKETRG